MNEDFKKLFDFNDYNYFYHMALNGNCDEICEEGLCLADKNYYSSMIEITKEMLNDTEEFLTGESNDFQKRTKMIIIRIPKEYGYDFIEPTPQKKFSWLQEEDALYYVRPEYIMGYVDLSSMEFMPNLVHCEIEESDEYFL